MGLFSAKISTKKMVPVCRQLASSYHAGIPIIRSFELLAQEQRDPKIRRVLLSMREDLKRGDTLAVATRQQSRYLPEFFIQLMAAGEQSGTLDTMLKDLGDYFEDRLTIQRSVVRALVYPSIQLTLAWFLGTFAFRMIGALSDFIKEVFSNGGGSQFDFETFLTDYAWFQGKAMLVLGVIIAASVVLSRMGLFGYVWGAIATHLWPISTVTRKFALARFFRSMALLIASGMRIDRCIENSANTTANPYIQKDLMQATPIVQDGGTLVQGFTLSRYLTPTAREMLLVGEESGNLEEQLRKVSEYHLEEANMATKIAVRMLGIAMVIGVAFLVGFLIIKFWTEYYGTMLNSLSM
jgi:type IV pilus assembly protein PilC